MNEVGITPIAVQKVGPVASSAGGVEAVAGANGKQLPPVTAEVDNEVSVKADIPLEDVEKAVASINDFVQSIQRDLQFTVDEELDKTVIKVVDGGSGELIRQIPEEAFLELARRLNQDGNLHLIDALG